MKKIYLQPLTNFCNTAVMLNILEGSKVDSNLDNPPSPYISGSGDDDDEEDGGAKGRNIWSNDLW